MEFSHPNKISGIDSYTDAVCRKKETSDKRQVEILEEFIEKKLKSMGFHFKDKTEFYEFCLQKIIKYSNNSFNYELIQFHLRESNERICTYKRKIETDINPPHFYGSITYEIY